jgi:hypothetical protein
MIAGYPGAEDHAGYLFFTFAACLGAIVVALHLLNNRSPYPLLAMAVAGSAFAAIVSLSPLVVSGTPFANLTAEPTLESVRGSGPFINPNYLGMFASTTLVATLGLWPILRSSRARFGLIATVLLLGGTVALSESRGAIVALLIGLCCLMYAKRRLLTIFVMVAGIVLTPVLYPMFQQWRLENLRGEASSAGYVAWAASDENRLAGAEVGPTLFLSSPIFGIGVGQYAPLSVQIAGRRTPIESHDWYINVLAGQGVVGMALWAAFSIAVVAKLRRVSRPSVRTLGGSVLATIAVSGLFTAPPTSFQEITIPAIVLAAVLVADWGEKPEADRSPEHMASRGAVLSTGANA